MFKVTLGCGLHCILGYVIAVDTTYRFDVKLEDLLHVGGNIGEEGVRSPVGACMGHDNCPHSSRGQDLSPRGPQLLQHKHNSLSLQFTVSKTSVILTLQVLCR